MICPHCHQTIREELAVLLITGLSVAIRYGG